MGNACAILAGASIGLGMRVFGELTLMRIEHNRYMKWYVIHRTSLSAGQKRDLLNSMQPPDSGVYYAT